MSGFILLAGAAALQLSPRLKLENRRIVGTVILKTAF